LISAQVSDVTILRNWSPGAHELDHKTLEETRIPAVQQVQSGENHEAVTEALGISRSRICSRLALHRPGDWDVLKARGLKERPTKWRCEIAAGEDPRQFRFDFAL
jgi:hypothetical protein